jgi:hypothetical protein
MRTTKHSDTVIDQIRAYREREVAPSGYNVQAAVAEFESLHRELMKTRSCEPVRPTVERRSVKK